MDAELPPEVRAVVDEAAIRRVLGRYCRGADRMDAELIRSCYHPDATDSHGTFSGTIDEYLVWVMRILGRYESTFHFLGSIAVEFPPATPPGSGPTRQEPPDVAHVETYGIAFHSHSSGEPKLNLVTGFRFVDRFERRAGDWRIASRTSVTEWSRIDPPDAHWPLKPEMLTGRRDRTDVVYARPW
jgi:SnoaL-like domain